MLRNYFKTAWRTLVKNKFYSIINISGLTVGLTIGILILLWVQDEFSFDAFHKKSPNIYKLENMVGTGPSRQLWSVTAAPIGVLAKKEIPGIEDVVRIAHMGYFGLFRYHDKLFSEDNYFCTDPSFFKVFDFNIIKGDAKNPFPDNNSVVLTESTAQKYFGTENPIGKVLTADDKVNLTVRGIIKDFPKNSTIKADMIFPMSIIATRMYEGNKEGKNLDNDFTQFNYRTFLLLKPSFSFAGFTDKVRQIHLRIKSDDTDVGYVLLPLAKMHLFKSDGTEGGYSTVRMFIIIALLILVIACINYVNLSTARSMLRAKEVSLRKIVGAAKFQLFLQFIVETTLLFVFATALALIAVYLLMPLFNQISGKELVLNYRDYHLWEIIAFTITGTLLISSIYPAILLSSFEPIKALKGKISARISDALFRKILVVTQFAFSMILITSTLVIGNQLKYIRSKQLGYDKDHVLAVNLINMNQHYDAIKSELLRQQGVGNITAASVNIVDYGGYTGATQWDGKEEGETLMVSPMSVDRNFLSFFNMQLAEGKGFTDTPADSAHFIMNEAAIKAARIKNPIGKKFKLWEMEGTIIGVAKDFHFKSMKQKIEPAVFYYKPSHYWKIYLKTNGKDAPKAIAALEGLWKKYNAGFPFEYSFLDESFNKLYKSEQRTGMLFNIFAVMAVFISCLGLLGLATYTAQVRTREIGIRKVLGASVTGIIRLLSTDFVKLVLIAIVIATPVTWYAMNKWLQDFAYKIDMGWAVFVFAGLIAFAIALFTISFQSVKAALANPVKSIKASE